MPTEALKFGIEIEFDAGKNNNIPKFFLDGGQENVVGVDGSKESIEVRLPPCRTIDEFADELTKAMKIVFENCPIELRGGHGIVAPVSTHIHVDTGTATVSSKTLIEFFKPFYLSTLSVTNPKSLTARLTRGYGQWDSIRPQDSPPRLEYRALPNLVTPENHGLLIRLIQRYYAGGKLEFEMMPMLVKSLSGNGKTLEEQSIQSAWEAPIGMAHVPPKIVVIDIPETHGIRCGVLIGKGCCEDIECTRWNMVVWKEDVPIPDVVIGNVEESLNDIIRYFQHSIPPMVDKAVKTPLSGGACHIVILRKEFSEVTKATAIAKAVEILNAKLPAEDHIKLAKQEDMISTSLIARWKERIKTGYNLPTFLQ